MRYPGGREEARGESVAEGLARRRYRVGNAEEKARLERMAARLRKGAQVLEELALEVEALISEERTPGQQANDFAKWYGEQWTKRHGGKYVDGGAKDRAQIKRLLGKLELAELQARAKRYLYTSDAYVVGARHPLGLFVSGVNKYGEDSGEPMLELEAARPADCKHEPACSSDQEHTRRKMADMRGGGRGKA